MATLFQQFRPDSNISPSLEKAFNTIRFDQPFSCNDPTKYLKVRILPACLGLPASTNHEKTTFEMQYPDWEEVSGFPIALITPFLGSFGTFEQNGAVIKIPDLGHIWSPDNFSDNTRLRVFPAAFDKYRAPFIKMMLLELLPRINHWITEIHNNPEKISSFVVLDAGSGVMSLTMYRIIENCLKFKLKNQPKLLESALDKIKIVSIDINPRALESTIKTRDLNQISGQNWIISMHDYVKKGFDSIDCLAGEQIQYIDLNAPYHPEPPLIRPSGEILNIESFRTAIHGAAGEIGDSVNEIAICAFGSSETARSIKLTVKSPGKNGLPDLIERAIRGEIQGFDPSKHEITLAPTHGDLTSREICFETLPYLKFITNGLSQTWATQMARKYGKITHNYIIGIKKVAKGAGNVFMLPPLSTFINPEQACTPYYIAHQAMNQNYISAQSTLLSN